MKKCPPGFICIENYLLFFIYICLFIFLYLIYFNVHKQKIIVNNNPTDKIVINDINRENPYGLGWNSLYNWMPSWPYTNLPSDPLVNPYAPPLRDERYLAPLRLYPNGIVPINVSTNIGAVDTQYRQVGILNATNSNGNILSLMGRPLFTNRDKWQYYTMNPDGNLNIKLPISRNGKSCTNEYGCDRLYNGDTVYVEGLNQPYRITMYDNDTIKYLPFL